MQGFEIREEKSRRIDQYLPPLPYQERHFTFRNSGGIAKTDQSLF